MHAAAAARCVEAGWGDAYLSPEIDRCYDRNMLWIAGDGDGLSASGVDTHAERLLGGAGMAHRRVMAEPAADARLRDGLVALGYEAGTHVFQVFGGRPAPEAVTGVGVEEASVDDVLAATEEYLRTDADTPYGRDPRTRRHLLEHYRDYGPAGAQERRFVVREDGGRVIAWARLWVRGDEAQVEDVVVLAPWRGRGYGRAIVTAATRAALDASPTLLFIVADADDWPKDLYARLGYETAGTLGVYLRFARLPQASGPGAA
ncbi:GNAT family N-acetyltransferase [Baekduia sp. Peel2402]|uniref:GNAT family N-acetyltransferase n=1 Tax=Baekduia sp. Peel2402 TaxID=3458296 RepID=UPI00403EE94B